MERETNEGDVPVNDSVVEHDVTAASSGGPTYIIEDNS